VPAPAQRGRLGVVIGMAVLGCAVLGAVLGPRLFVGFEAVGWGIGGSAGLRYGETGVAGYGWMGRGLAGWG
jgi:hypothetical protein